MRVQEKTLFVFLLCMGAFVFSCSDLSFSDRSMDQLCLEENGEPCKYQGDTTWLEEKSVDILISLDNTALGQELNPKISSNLNEFLKCVAPADWRVGFLPGAQKPKPPSKLGELIPLEIAQKTSKQKIITPDMPESARVFEDTVSLRSGCSYPPFCAEGQPAPLQTIKAFMNKKQEKARFLRPNVPLVLIVVSLSGEDSPSSAVSSQSAQSLLTQLSAKYSAKDLLAITVTNTGQEDDCVHSNSNFLSDGMGYVAKAGQAVGLVTVMPELILASALLSLLADEVKKEPKTPEHSMELARFAKRAGGGALNVCKDTFGRALAFSVLKHLNMENRFPDECKKFNSPNRSDNVDI